MRRVAMRTIHEVEVELIAPSLSAGRILYFGYSGLTVSSLQQRIASCPFSVASFLYSQERCAFAGGNGGDYVSVKAERKRCARPTDRSRPICRSLIELISDDDSIGSAASRHSALCHVDRQLAKDNIAHLLSGLATLRRIINWEFALSLGYP
ncbi:hypothetical protein S7335_590 [Synechococcus sp. PCC 7335]|nr:hypothetical protein S7335_590 [Synechococcus sp. PCC 7335]